MGSDSILPPSLRLTHLWPSRDIVEQRERLKRDVLAECERVSELLDIDSRDLKREALFLLENSHLAPVLTPERLELERQTMHAAARRRCDRIGIDFEDVRAEVDQLVDILAQAAPGH